VPVQYGNRNYTNGNARNISAWSVFNFSGRGNKYSSFKWNASCFNGVDYDNNTGSNQVFRFSNKNWDWEVDNENGNYDYLMYADIDFDCDYVVDELKNWGEWYVEFANLDGFRLDAVKHIKFDFYKDWLTTVRSRTGKELFAVGEYWSPDVNKLNNYINVTGGTTSLFDVPLHMNFYNASNSSGNYDMRKIADGTLVASNPVKAVTFVDNHDTQAGQSLQSPVMYWFRPLAYSYILTREQGYPCVFYPDYYGYADGQASHKAVLDKLMEARTKYAYGKQRDYFDHKDVIGWTREGDSSHANSGLAALITDGPGGSKKMYVGTSHAGEVWKDITGNVSGTVTIGSDGYGTFSVDGGSTSVWVYSSAGTATVLTSSRSVTSSASAAQTLSLASTTASTTTYTSSNSSVKVSSKGKVTIPKNFAGKVTITVKKKNKVTEKITINVKPAKATLSSVTNKSGKKLQVKWKKLSYVTGYEIRYSNSSSFKSGNKTVKITKASTVSKTITGLTKGKTYYVKVRAYKQDGKTTINGSWSTAKKIKITK
jgi:alpha-amylase